MPALILKSGNALNAGVKSIEFSAYKQRVLADGGYIVNEQVLENDLRFLVDNHVPSSSVASATSANWGVKLDGGTLLKLYNLCDASGDIICNVTDKVKHVVSGDKAYLDFTQASASVLETFGIFNNVENAIVNVVARYGANTVGDTQPTSAIASLHTKAASTSSADMVMQRPMYISMEKNGSTQPAQFVEKLNGYIPSGFITLPIVGGFSNWVTSVNMLGDSKLKNFRNGVLNTAATLPTPRTVKDALYFAIGSRRSTNAVGAFARDHYFVGQIAEAWLLINSSEEVAKALSLRASQKYTG